MRVLALFLIAFLSVTITQQTNAAEYHKIADSSLLENIFTNKTFFKRNDLNRMFFNSDKTFLQQINEGGNAAIPVGTILKGEWSVRNNHLCWFYDQTDRKSYSIDDTEFCYAVYSDTLNTDNFMKYYRDTFMLYRIENNGQENISESFRFNQWMVNNYVFDPEIVPQLMRDLKTASSYIAQPALPDGTVAKDQLSSSMQDYYDIMIGNVFVINDNYIYFHPSGRYFSTSKSRIERAANDMQAILAADRFGQWTMKDNIHCFFRPGRNECEIVFPIGKGLYRNHDQVLGVYHSGFGRLHSSQEGVLNYLSPENVPYSDIFKEAKRLMDAQK